MFKHPILYTLLTITCLISNANTAKANNIDIYEKETNKENKDNKKKSQPKISDIHYTNKIRIKNNAKYNTIQPYKLSKLYLFTTNEKHRYKLQTLGIDASPVYTPFNILPKHIGITSGLNNHKIHFTDIENIKIYKTEFPYTHFYFIPGNEYSKFNFTYTVQLKKNLNIGIESNHTSKHPTTKSKLLHKRIYNINLFTNYTSPTKLYQSLVTLTTSKYYINETGGKNVKSTKIQAFFTDKVKNRLENEIQNTNIQNTISIYNQLAINNFSHIYHELIHQKQSYTTKFGQASFNQTQKKEKENKNQTIHQSWTNEIGWKSQIQNYFYRIYGKTKDIKHNYKYINKTPNKYTEIYLGTNTQYTTKNKSNKLNLETEYLFKGLFNIITSHHNKYTLTKIRITKYKPSIIQNKYQSKYHNPKKKNKLKYKPQQWKKNFKNPFAINIHLKGKINLNIINIQPYIELTTIQNHILFKTKTNTNYLKKTKPKIIPIQPIQLKSTNTNIKPGIIIKTKIFTCIHSDTEISFNKFLGKNKHKLTITENKTTFHSKIYYGDHLYKNNLYLESGINIHYNLGYMDYDPITQQFFIQTYFNTYSYPILDLFTALKSNKLGLFFIVKNINKGFFAPGYFTAPHYTGEKRSLYFGISWHFFD